MKRSLIFFGSPDFSADILKNIFDTQNKSGIEISLVVTQPDRPAGRGMRLQMTPVKRLATDLGLQVFEFTKDRKPDLIDKIRAAAPAFGVLYAFNEMITEDIMSLFPRGIWNIHPSLLPAFRGPSPIAYPLMLGSQETGVTIMKIAKGLDTGDILASARYDIAPNDTVPTVLSRLSQIAFGLLLDLFGKNDVEGIPQENSGATYTSKLTKETGYIPFDVLKAWCACESAKTSSIPVLSQYLSKYSPNTPPEYLEPKYLFNLWRGLHPWPGIWTKVMINGKETRLKILDVDYDEIAQKPILKTVQLEGKNSVTFTQFVASYKIFG